MAHFDPASIKALTFDVFGTVVDWRSSITREGQDFGKAHGFNNVDWVNFADRWRGMYQPAMDEVRSGRRPWVKLDVLHRESLDKLAAEFGSNGNVALMVNMARRAGLPWDTILGAEVTRHYKPQPECYLGTADMLGLKPEECALVAAHNGDLGAASKLGFKTVFVPRPAEHGTGQTKDIRPEREWSVIARDFVDLADQLGC